MVTCNKVCSGAVGHELISLQLPIAVAETETGRRIQTGSATRSFLVLLNGGVEEESVQRDRRQISLREPQ